MRKIFAFLIGVILCTTAGAATLIHDTETERLLAEIIAPLGTAADIPDGRMKIHIVNDDDFNAFVAGGEDVYVYTGLLTQIKNPNALQAVIAHELGHTLGGHMAQMSARQSAEMTRTMLIQALGVGLMVAGGNPSLGAGVMAGGTGVATQSMLAFTRDEERIADNMGLDLMYQAKLNPNGFIDVFTQMNDISGEFESKINPNRINHPLTAERLKNVREHIDRRGNKYTPTARDKKMAAQYELVRAKLIGYLGDGSVVKTKYPTSDMSDAALYARAIARMNAGNLNAARTGVQTLISRNPDNPYYYELLGDIDYQLGHYDDSADAYEKSLSLAGDNAPQIQTARALVLAERNKPGDAVAALELCRRALLSDAMPLTYWVMARAYDNDASDAHADGRADWARAEYYHLIGNKKQAKKYANAAQKSLPSNTPEYIKSGDLLRALK